MIARIRRYRTLWPPEVTPSSASGLSVTPPQRIYGLLLSGTACVGDYLLVSTGGPWSPLRLLLPLLVVFGYQRLLPEVWSAVAATLWPQHNSRRWFTWASLGALYALVGLLARPIPPEHAGRLFLYAGTVTPVMEELVYRLAMISGLLPVLRWRGAIAVSAISFWGLHALYGSLSLNQLLGGMFLGWLFVGSGSVLVPLTAHYLMNWSHISIRLLHWLIVR